jgi:hypothetical protein
VINIDFKLPVKLCKGLEERRVQIKLMPKYLRCFAGSWQIAVQTVKVNPGGELESVFSISHPTNHGRSQL